MADSGRLQGVISTAPQFAPRSFVQTFGFQRISAWWLFEIIAITVLFFWALFQALRQHDRERLPLLMVCALLIFPFLEWSTTGYCLAFLDGICIANPAGKSEVGSAKSAVCANSEVDFALRTSHFGLRMVLLCGVVCGVFFFLEKLPAGLA